MVFTWGMTATQTTDINLRNVTGTNWITGTWGPFNVEALAFPEGSDEYGMEQERRISKLWVSLPASTGQTVLYDYDRGELMANRITAAGLAEILDALDATIPAE